jgi:hypothetical protein
MNYSVALTGEAHAIATRHLLRPDGQEDLCFALWHPSRGAHRKTALIAEIILPNNGERLVHGNASFKPEYFERVVSRALQTGAGIVFMHSHLGPGWQDMSDDDIQAEHGRAAASKGATGLPLVGLTLGTDETWSARVWEKTGAQTYERFWCESVKVVGEAGVQLTYADHLGPPPGYNKRLDRTVSAWGTEKQQKLARLRIGIIGAGSVGSIVAEALARMGVAHVKLLDFDIVEEHNLDRILNVDDQDIGTFKVDAIAHKLKKSATAQNFRADAITSSIAEESGYREALDCDLLFSCVDRPWARSVLNAISYAHLIPVIDGGIGVKTKTTGTILGADWKAHAVMPSRRCLECLGQYDPGLVQAERDGYFDDPEYIKSLAADHPIKQNQNVFAFSLDTAALEILQMLSLVISPLGISNFGEYNYHFVTGSLDIERDKSCNDGCPYPLMTGRGDTLPYKLTGLHKEAERTRSQYRPPHWYDLIFRFFQRQ